jgi:hypothetical protein
MLLFSTVAKKATQFLTAAVVVLGIFKKNGERERTNSISQVLFNYLNLRLF